MKHIRDYTSYERGFNKPLRRGEFPECCRALIRELQNIPAYQGGPLYRGTRLSRVEQISAGELKLGAILRDPAFFSCSTSKAISRSFEKDCQVLIQESFSGRSIRQWSEFAHECEVLFAPGTKFRVVKVNKPNPSFTVITVKEIPSLYYRGFSLRYLETGEVLAISPRKALRGDTLDKVCQKVDLYRD